MNYQGQLLVAQPGAPSSFFQETVVAVCEHHTEGSWGLVLNKPIAAATVGEVAQEFDLEYPDNTPLYLGGPVDTQGLHILHTPDLIEHNTWFITDDLCVTSSVEVLAEICQGRGPSQWRMFLGFSGWGPGQLDGEQSGLEPWSNRHKWLTLPIKPNVLELPVKSMWTRCLNSSITESVEMWFN